MSARTNFAFGDFGKRITGYPYCLAVHYSHPDSTTTGAVEARGRQPLFGENARCVFRRRESYIGLRMFDDTAGNDPRSSQT